MNLVVEPTFTTLDCTRNRNDVVLLIYIGDQKPSAALKQLFVDSVKKDQNYKIFLFEQSISQATPSATYLLIKKMLRATDRIKIIFYTQWSEVFKIPHFKYHHMWYIFEKLKFIQLPYTVENLGFVLVLDTANQMETSLGRLVLNSYKSLRCEIFGCPGLDIILNKFGNSSFTNILTMTRAMGSKNLTRFINQRLTFSNLDASDVDVFSSKVVDKLFDFYNHDEGYRQLIRTDIKAQSLVWGLQPEHISVLLKFRPRSKRQVCGEFDFPIFTAFVKVLANFETNQFTDRIRKGALRLISNMDKDVGSCSENLVCQTVRDNSEIIDLNPLKICPNPTQSLVSALCRANNHLSLMGLHLEFLAKSLNSEHINRWNRVHSQTGATYSAKIISDTREQVRSICERTFQTLATQEQITRRLMAAADLETALNQWISELTEWADAVPIDESKAVTWRDFRNWVTMRGSLHPAISVKASKALFEFSNTGLIEYSDLDRRFQVKLKFKQMIRELLIDYCRNVSTQAIQALAVTKATQVDAIVAVLDRKFVAELTKFHHTMDREQWLLQRPQIFYHLMAIQEERMNFRDFYLAMHWLFDHFDFETPRVQLASLQRVNAEFEVYQIRLERYINGSINTAHEWGREFKESTEYFHRNSGAQQTSVINDAAQWMMGSASRETFSSYNFAGTLVLLNWLVRKCFQMFKRG